MAKRELLGTAVLSLFLLLVGLCPAALAQSKAAEKSDNVALAVFPFQVNADPELGYLHDSLPQLLADKLAQEGFKVVPYDRVMATLAKEKVEFLDPQAVRGVTLMEQAKWGIYGSFSQAGEAISLDVRLVEGFGLKDPRNVFVTKNGLINLLPAMDEVVAKIKQELLQKDLVTDIEVKGTEALDKEVVLMRVQTGRGEIYDPKKANDDLRRIYEVGYFDDVRVDLVEGSAGKKLVYTVKEKPRIQAVGFEGNSNISSDKLMEAISTKAGGVLNLKILAEDLNKIRELYRKDAYYLAEVNYDLQSTDTRAARLNIKVNEGQKLYIRTISVDGAQAVSDSDLKKELALSERGFFSWLTGSGVLKEELLDRDAAAMEAYYANRGYMDAKVGQPQVEFKDDGIHISFPVQEGPRYKVGKVAFAGDLFEDPEVINTRIKLDDLARDEAYLDRSVVRQDTKVLTDYYTDFGYAFANVDVDFDVKREAKLVDVTYKINKNQKVYIRRVNLEGNTKTRDNVIRREMLVGDGDAYHGSRLARSSERLSKLDYFKGVEIETVPTGDPGQLDLKVKVQEKPTGAFTIGAGYSNVDKVFFGGNIEEKNLFGRGYTLGFGGKFGSRNTSFTLSFVNPRVFDTKLLFGVDAYWLRTIYEEYERKAIGSKLRFGYPIGEYTRLYWSYKLERYNIDKISPNASRLIRDHEGGNWASVASASVERDTTDNRFLPSRGTINTATVDYGGGVLMGDDHFIRYVYSSHWFQSLLWKTVLHLHGQVGYVMKNFNDKQIPPYERFYLGGINTVRGYAGRGISPKDPLSGDRIGGNKEFFVNTELVFPLYPEYRLYGVAFFDAGNAWDDDESYFEDPRRSGKDSLPLGLYKSVGMGIRWYSPLGPLRIEYGWPLDKLEDQDQKGKIEFSVGATF